MKILLITIFILYSCIGTAQIKTKAHIDFGYSEWKYILYRNVRKIKFESGNVPLMTSLSFEAKYKGFFAETTLESYINKVNKKIASKPVYTDYKISLGYTYKWISIYYQHSCIHTTHEPTTTIIYKGGYDKLFVRLNLWGNDR